MRIFPATPTVNDPAETVPPAGRRLRMAAAIVSAVAAATLGAACSSGGSSSHAAGFGVPASATHTAPSGHRPARGASPQAGPATTPLPPVTFTAYDFAGQSDTYSLTVDDLVRQGPFVRLDVTILCRTVDGCNGTSEFRTNQTNYSDDDNTLDEIELVDPVNKTEYQPVLDAKGEPLSSELPDTIPGGATQRGWVTFPAPPRSVHNLTILLPQSRVELFDVGLPATDANWYPQAKAAPFSQPVTSTDTSGLRLPVYDLSSTSVPGLVGQSTSGGQTTVTLSTDVLFDFNSATLTGNANQALDLVAQSIDSSGQGTVVVTGYTDNIGDPGYNQQLSQQRAQSVVSALQAKATTASVSYQAVGMGEADPVAPNQNPDGSDNPAGRAQNRRVTISYTVSQSGLSSSSPTTAPTAAPAPSGSSATYSLSLPDSEGQETYQVAANGTHADGSFTVLEATVTCVRSDDSDGCDTQADFGNPNGQDPNGSLTDGIQLIDRSNATTYNPLEAGGVPVGSRVPSALPAGASVPIWVWYATPARASLSVQLPNGGPVIGA